MIVLCLFLITALLYVYVVGFLTGAHYGRKHLLLQLIKADAQSQRQKINDLYGVHRDGSNSDQD